MKRLTSLLLGSLVMATSGLGIADSASVDMVVQTTHFDAKTGLLSVVIPGGGSTELLRTGTTTYEATVIKKLPPGPCRAIGKVWNFAVQDHAPPLVFDILLFDMALAKCDARVSVPAGTAASGGTASPILAIKPGL